MQGVHLRFQWSGDGLPAAQAVVEALARELAAGVALTRASAGFGPRTQTDHGVGFGPRPQTDQGAGVGPRPQTGHGVGFGPRPQTDHGVGVGPRPQAHQLAGDEPSPAPVVVEWIESLEHVAWAWPRLLPLLGDALVSRQEVVLVTPIPPHLRRLRLDVEVETVMRPSLISVDAALPLAEVRRLLAASGVETVPVLDANGAVAGVIRASALPAEPDGATAASALDGVLVTAAPEARLRDVVALLLRHGVDEVPVVADRAPVGLVGLDDALRLVAPDEDAPAGGAATAAVLRARVPGL